MHLIIRHEFDGRVREYTQERRRVALKEPQNARVLVYLRSSAEGTTPCTWKMRCQPAQPLGGAQQRTLPAYFWNSGFEA